MPRNAGNAMMSLGGALGYQGGMSGWCAGVTTKWLEADLINNSETFVKRMNRIRAEVPRKYIHLFKPSRDPTTINIDELAQLLEEKNTLLQYQEHLFYFDIDKKTLIDVTDSKEVQAFQDDFTALENDTIKNMTLIKEDQIKAMRLDTYLFNQQMVEQINAAKEKSKTPEGRQTLTDDEKELLNIPAFYDGVQLYMFPHVYGSVFNQEYHQRQVDEISAYATSEIVEELGGIKTIHSESQISTIDETTAYLQELQTIFNEHATDTVAIRVTNYNHMVGISYNVKTKEWTYMDINYGWPPFTSPNPNEIAKRLKENFDKVTDETIKKDYTAFNSNIIIPSERANPQLVAALDTFKKENIKKITPEIAQRGEGANLLTIATLHGQTDIVTALLEQGASPNVKTIRGGAALITAAEQGHISTLRALLEHNADLNITNKYGSTAMHVAALYNQPEVINILKQKGADLQAINNAGRTPFMLAADGNCMDAMKKIMALDTNTDIHRRDNQGQNAIYIAAAAGYSNIVAFLIEEGADLHIKSHNNTTALFAAVNAGHPKVVKLLLDNGAAFADPNDPETTHSTLQTAIQRILEHPQNREKTATLNVLLTTGVSLQHIDVTMKTKLLLIAVDNGHFNIVEQLLKQPSDLNIDATNNKGQTALYLAASHGDSDILELLIRKGANPNIASNDESTPLLRAITSARPNVVKTLLDNNAIFAHPSNDQEAKITKLILNTAIQYAVAEPQNNNKMSVLGTLLATGVDLKNHKKELNNALKMAIETKNAPLILELFRSPHLDVWKIPYKAKNAILQQLAALPKDDSYRAQFAAEILENKESKLHQFFHERARFTIGTVNISAKPKETTGNLKEALILAKQQFQEKEKEKESDSDSQGEGVLIHPHTE